MKFSFINHWLILISLFLSIGHNNHVVLETKIQFQHTHLNLNKLLILKISFWTASDAWNLLLDTKAQSSRGSHFWGPTSQTRCSVMRGPCLFSEIRDPRLYIKTPGSRSSRISNVVRQMRQSAMRGPHLFSAEAWDPRLKAKMQEPRLFYRTWTPRFWTLRH